MFVGSSLVGVVPLPYRFVTAQPLGAELLCLVFKLGSLGRLLLMRGAILYSS
jgi:hypothetical protein